METPTPSQVMVLGKLHSSTTTRVEIALKLKGIPYEFVQEDTTNKSELLLRYNPVHKKVPVLVHNGRAIAESLIILEYIDEQWDLAPKLLPKDPFARAKIRFWADFYDNKLRATTRAVFISNGMEQEKAIEDYKDLIKVFEEGIQRDFPSKLPFYGEDNHLGYLGIIVGANAGNYKAFNNAFGTAILDPETTLFIKWVDDIIEHSVMKDTLTPPDELAALLSKQLHPTQP